MKTPETVEAQAELLRHLKCAFLKAGCRVSQYEGEHPDSFIVSATNGSAARIHGSLGDFVVGKFWFTEDLRLKQIANAAAAEARAGNRLLWANYCFTEGGPGACSRGEIKLEDTKTA
jgi:hypothetical protein